MSRTACCLLVCWLALLGNVRAEEALHARIDQIIAAAAGGNVAAPSSDSEFIRRVYLDLAGRIPSLTETKAFLANTATDKRIKLVDHLLSSEDHARRMSQLFHVMLMERLGDHEEWRKFLTSSFQANKPWDLLVREMLAPDANNEATRGSAFWFSKRLENYGQNPVDMPALVRDVGRHFLGIDVQCAQCHDHLFVDEYKQEFYHGLHAFVGHAVLRNDVKFPAVALKPLDKKAEFMSVFIKEPKSVGPKLPGAEEVAIPTFAKGEEFEQKPEPGKKIPGVPKFNTLKILAEQLPRSDNRLFTRNIANRLWWVMLGRGLVWPLDWHHSANAPSHPELMDLLSQELVNHQFDMRWLLREMALSETYQRTSVAPDAAALTGPVTAYRFTLEKPLSPEQTLAGLRQALGDGQPLIIPNGDKSWTEWQTKFEKALGNPAREPEVEHSPTVKGALFIMHDASLLEWIQPAGDNLAARLVKHTDAALLAEELYLTIYSRVPNAEEKQTVVDYLAKQPDHREAAIVNLIWASVAANEFLTNY